MTVAFLIGIGEPLYGYQTPNGYSDLAENWVNTGALLERLNFGLALASNRIPGTKVNLRRFVGDTSSEADKPRMMDQFLSVIVGGDISPRTKETLMKQLDEQIPAPPPPSKKLEEEKDAAMLLGTPLPEAPRQTVARPASQAAATDTVTKMVGLILGSPEFQRQ